MSNPYEILNVNKSSSLDEIKKSFRKLSMKHHPDRNGNTVESTETFQKISEAFDILSNSEKKREYDMEQQFGGGGMSTGMPPGFPGVFMGGGININDILGEMMNGGGGGDGFMGPNIKVFRNGHPVNFQQKMQKPIPIVKNIKVSLEQSYNGSNIPIEIERWIHINNSKNVETETIYITIPKGIDNNEMIVIPNKGNIISDDNRGDIKICFTVENSFKEFTRNGLDLIYTKKLSLKESLCGFEFIITHLNGKVLTLKNANTIIKPGGLKQIPNLGLPRENNIGSLIIKFEIDFPTKLSDEQISGLKNIL